MSEVVRRVTGRSEQGEEQASRSPWLSDAPSDLSSEKDAFEVKAIIEGLTSLLSEADPPFTLSLSGSWGVGKSTIAEAVVDGLRKQGTPAVIVDLWSEDITNLRRTLVIRVGAAVTGIDETTIAKQLDGDAAKSVSESATGRTKFSVAGLWKALWADKTTALIFAGLAVVLLLLLTFWPADTYFGRALPAIATAFIVLVVVQSGFMFVTGTTSTTRGPAERSVVVAEHFRLYVTGQGVKNAPQRVLVLVDNLDRLPGEDAVKALSEIRALIDIDESLCLFLIPVDRDALAGHIKSALEGPTAPPTTPTSEAEAKPGPGGSSTSTRQTDAAKQYLDKFFNLDLLLTEPAPVDIRDWALVKALEVLPNDDPKDVEAAVQTIVSAAGTSPRAVKRIINGVSSRRRLLGGSEAKVSLTQIAFVESVLTQFPGLLSWMNSEPRHFVAQREELAKATSEAEQAHALRDLPAEAHVDADGISRLAQFLFTNRAIELRVVDVSLILSLRSDSQWRGVTDPTDLRDAVTAGNAAAFGSALTATPVGERSIAVRRATEWIEKSATKFHRDAINGVIAVIDGLTDLALAPTTLYSVVVKALLLADDADRARVTVGVASFALSPPTGAAPTRSLAEAFAKTAEANPLEGGLGEGLIRAIQLGAAQLPPERHEAVRQSLSSASDVLLTPLFEPEVDVALVAGPIARRYGQLVEVADLEAATGSPDEATAVPPQLYAAERVAAFRRAGGDADGEFIRIATRLSEQLKAATGDLSPASLRLIAVSPEILDGLTGDEIEAYALALATKTAPSRAPYFEAAFGLDLREPSLRQVAASFETWLDTATATEMRAVLEARSEAITRSATPWPTHLITLWASRGDYEIARLVADLGPPETASQMIAAVRPLAVGVVGPRLEELVGAFRGRAHQTELLTAEIARLAAEIVPVAETQILAPAVARLRRDGVDVNVIAEAIGKRAISLSTIDDVAALVRSAAAFDAAGIAEIVHEAQPLAERSASIDVVDPDAAVWLARRASDKADPTAVVLLAIRYAGNPIAKVVEVARAVRKDLGALPEIALALVERARESSLSDDQVTEVLTEAMAYKAQPAKGRAAYRAELSAIATERPALDELINRMKQSRKK